MGGLLTLGALCVWGGGAQRARRGRQPACARTDHSLSHQPSSSTLNACTRTPAAPTSCTRPPTRSGAGHHHLHVLQRGQHSGRHLQPAKGRRRHQRVGQEPKGRHQGHARGRPLVLPRRLRAAGGARGVAGPAAAAAAAPVQVQARQSSRRGAQQTAQRPVPRPPCPLSRSSSRCWWGWCCACASTRGSATLRTLRRAAASTWPRGPASSRYRCAAGLTSVLPPLLRSLSRHAMLMPPPPPPPATPADAKTAVQRVGAAVGRPAVARSKLRVFVQVPGVVWCGCLHRAALHRNHHPLTATPLACSQPPEQVDDAEDGRQVRRLHDRVQRARLFRPHVWQVVSLLRPCGKSRGCGALAGARLDTPRDFMALYIALDAVFLQHMPLAANQPANQPAGGGGPASHPQHIMQVPSLVASCCAHCPTPLLGSIARRRHYRSQQTGPSVRREPVRPSPRSPARWAWNLQQYLEQRQGRPSV